MKSYKTIAVSILMLAALIATPVTAGLTFTTSCPQTIAKGDTITITGTGATNGSVAVMVFGRHYFHTFMVNPDERGDFTVMMKPDETRAFSSGQYAFVVLDPGANGKLEIGSRITGDGNISITDHGVTAAEPGPASSLNANVQPVVSSLLAISGRPGVDDVVTAAYFFVEEPFIHFDQDRDPVTHQTVPGRDGDNRLHFSGTTNMGDENTLSAKVYNTENRDLVIITDIPVLVQDGVTEPGRNKELNLWSYEMDPAQLPPGEYILTVGWQKEKTTGTGTVLFTVPDTSAISRPSGLLPFFQARTLVSLPEGSSFSGILFG
ncbi:MAG: hypothetical protein M0Q92_12805 [Methanoregula sp.]|jgi:hypothetical protein|nr:hypothetical protein [Methanoregula sp.]